VLFLNRCIYKAIERELLMCVMGKRCLGDALTLVHMPVDGLHSIANTSR
jgi:hypothetical protein